MSRDGKQYTLSLRHGLRFSDGQPFNADDVLFTFQVYLDEKIHSPQRDLLVVAGKPIEVNKLDDYTVRFDLAAPYAAAERLSMVSASCRGTFCRARINKAISAQHGICRRLRVNWPDLARSA